MTRFSRRDLMIAAAGCAGLPLTASRLSAAETKVDLSSERVGQAPSRFQPIVGTWRVIQDGGDKVVMVDGQPWKASQNNRTTLLAERARSFYNASQEDFVDTVKQFAYYPIATLNGVDNFTNGTITMKFKTVSGDLDRASGILFNVKPNGDWLSTRYNDTEFNITLWTFSEGLRKMVRRGPGREPWHLPRNEWHELKLTVQGPDTKTYINGQLALEYTWTSPISGKVGLWSKTDSTSYFKDFTVQQS
jgi:hypothetical protein